jgi:hypothetical protein
MYELAFTSAYNLGKRTQNSFRPIVSFRPTALFQLRLKLTHYLAHLISDVSALCKKTVHSRLTVLLLQWKYSSTALYWLEVSRVDTTTKLRIILLLWVELSLVTKLSCLNSNCTAITYRGEVLTHTFLEVFVTKVTLVKLRQHRGCGNH